jgi:hypothetical protein
VQPPSPFPDTGTEVVYVDSVTGRDDAGRGLKAEAPVRTVNRALVVAGESSSLEIRLCGGEYANDSLIISKAIILNGAYDCKTWLRQANFDKKGGFAGLKRTILRRTVDKSGPALVIESAGKVGLSGIDLFGAVSGEALSIKRQWALRGSWSKAPNSIWRIARFAAAPVPLA